MLNYPITQTCTLIGTKSGTTRTGVELESTYSETLNPTEPTNVIQTEGMSKMNLSILYNMGASETGNSLEIKIESSPDGTNWYRVANDSTSGGTSTITAREFTFVGTDGGAATIGIFFDIAYKYVRVSCKETGVATNKGDVYIEATLSGK